MYIYDTYIYIYREREGERERGGAALAEDVAVWTGDMKAASKVRHMEKNGNGK